jgi:CheY-like chemotaxis protein
MQGRQKVSLGGHQPRDGAPSVSTGARRGQILLIDYDRLFATAMERCLAGAHDVVVLQSADEALRMLEGGARFDLIFCDMTMPDMNGMEFFAALTERSREHAMRTVFLTGGAFTEEVRSFLDSVPNPCLEKPFDVEKLTQLTRHWIGPERPEASATVMRSA